MLKNFKEPKIRNVIIIYFVATAVYAFAALFMKVAPHVRVDEDLYLSLARSFFKGDGFLVHGQITDYTSILYSLIISPVYAFYSPAFILPAIRVLNAFIMCSVVFPVYLLSKETVPEKYVICLTVFSVLIPDMVDIFYIMQENLYYPLALWCFYFVYKDIRETEIKRNTCICAVFFAFLFFTKNVSIAFFIGYLFVKILKKQIKAGAIATAIFGGFVILWKLIISVINGFSEASNHYSNQLEGIFPITYITAVAVITGILVYIVFFLMCTGVLPTVMPLIKQKTDRFQIFIYSSAVLIILETVFLVFLSEEQGEFIPHKFLFRYFFPILIVLIMYMVKELADASVENTDIDKSNVKSETGIKQNYLRLLLIISGIVFFGAAVYYLIVGLSARNSLCDSHLNMLLETGNKIAGRFFAPALLIVSGTLLIVLANGLLKKQGIQGLVRKWCLAALVFTLAFLPLNMFQHVYYSRTVVNGTVRQNDFIKLADELGRNDIDVYVVGRIHVPECMVFGYIYQDYILMETTEEIANSAKAGDIMITSKNALEEMQGFHKAAEEYDTIDVWIK